MTFSPADWRHFRRVLRNVRCDAVFNSRAVYPKVCITSVNMAGSAKSEVDEESSRRRRVYLYYKMRAGCPPRPLPSRKFQDGGKLSFHDAAVVTVNFMYVIFKPYCMDSVINNLNQTSLTRLHCCTHAHVIVSHICMCIVLRVSILIFLHAALQNIEKRR